MYDSGSLEYIAASSGTNKSYHSAIYFSRNAMAYDKFDIPIPVELSSYNNGKRTTFNGLYNIFYDENAPYSMGHSFTPEIFLTPSRSGSMLVAKNNNVKYFISAARQAFELMAGKKIDENISISVLPDDEFRMLHSIFGKWSEGILGFSINGHLKKIFVRENNLDVLMIVIGHEIGHVLTETLPNRHDEEAKAFAFSIEWAKTIKKQDIAGLGMSIKEEFDFKPARNGLHDVAFEFVIHEVRKGRSACELHKGLAGKYISLFNTYA